jgi:hypothetical protein
MSREEMKQSGNGKRPREHPWRPQFSEPRAPEFEGPGRSKGEGAWPSDDAGTAAVNSALMDCYNG